jgi:hypothetical protein
MRSGLWDTIARTKESSTSPVIARIIVVVLGLAFAGWVFYRFIYPNLRRGGK